MIGRITGLILEKKPPYLLVDVNGLGYELQCPMSTFTKLGNLGERVTLHTHYVVREDAHLLYGFYTEKERRLFKEITKVSGIGPKIALAVLSSMAVENFVQHILDQDAVYLTKLPGVGKKTAERLVVEMRDRLKTGWHDLFSDLAINPAGFVKIDSQSKEEALQALLALGYKNKEANSALSKVTGNNLSSEEMIKSALQVL